MAFDMDYCFRRNDKIIYKEINSVPSLIDPYRRTLVKLNPTAHKIWQLSDGEHSVADIVEILEAEFEIDAENLKRDMMFFLKDLLKREMIK